MPMSAASSSSSACYRYFTVHTGWVCLSAAVAAAMAWLHILPRYPAYIIDGVSMEPAIPDKAVVYTRAAPVIERKIVKGDIVIAVNPTKNSELICKRVVSMGGDSVTYRKMKSSQLLTTEVPKHSVWLQGDNADESIDSRVYGSLHYSMLVSKVDRYVIPLTASDNPMRPMPVFCPFNLD